MEGLRSSEQEAQGIVDAIPQAIAVLSPDGQLLYGNRSLLQYTGLTIAEVTSADFRARVFHPEDVARLREERRDALARGVPFEFEQRARRHDGQYGGSSSSTTRCGMSTVRRCAGTRRAPTSMIASGPKSVSVM